MDFTVEHLANTEVVTFEGALTIRYAHELRDALINVLEQAPNLVINLEKVTDIDLSGLQLLCSAYQTAVLSNKRFTLAGNHPPVLAQAGKDAGFSDCPPFNFLDEPSHKS